MIARRRKRPRVRSVSFRTFFWLIRSEAELYVMTGRYHDADYRRFGLWWFKQRTTWRRRRAAWALLEWPARRFKP
jgi:hypothetical protein